MLHEHFGKLQPACVQSQAERDASTIVGHAQVRVCVALHDHRFRTAADVQLVLVIGGHTAVRDHVQGRRSGGPFFAKVPADDRVHVAAAEHELLDERLNVDVVEPPRLAIPLVQVLREPMEDRPALFVHPFGPLLLGDDLGGDGAHVLEKRHPVVQPSAPLLAARAGSGAGRAARAGAGAGRTCVLQRSRKDLLWTCRH